jgi:hypothetical protein
LPALVSTMCPWPVSSLSLPPSKYRGGSGPGPASPLLPPSSERGGGADPGSASHCSPSLDHRGGSDPGSASPLLPPSSEHGGGPGPGPASPLLPPPSKCYLLRCRTNRIALKSFPWRNTFDCYLRTTEYKIKIKALRIRLYGFLPPNFEGTPPPMSLGSRHAVSQSSVGTTDRPPRTSLS